MKTRTLLFLYLILGFSLTPLTAQNLQKGNLLGMHVINITLAPNVTMEKFLDFYTNKFIPEYEKNFPGIKLYVIKGIRGENENKFGLVYVLKSTEVRDKYWPQKDVSSDVTQAGMKKLEPLVEERKKLATWTEASQTDWIIL